MNQAVRTIAEKRELGAKIAAIEGLSLTSELTLLFEQFDAANKTPSERIKLIHQYFDNATAK
jgi:hypothetical protein